MTTYRFDCSSNPRAFLAFESPFDDDRAALHWALQKTAGHANIEIDVSAGDRYVGQVSLCTYASVEGEQLGANLLARTTEAAPAEAFDHVLAER